MTLEHEVIFDLEKISSRLVLAFLTISTIRTSEIIQICLLAREENKARGY
jgi:hypothetical protein